MLGNVLYPIFRRVDFRGKGRLRRRLPVPEEGRPIVRFSSGVRLRLDLRESLQRDYFFGQYDLYALQVISRQLRGGGDFVDVGAHIGMYTVRAGLELEGRGRVLALEPNPDARAQLVENVALNGCDNVIVVGAAASAAAGRGVLRVPVSPDSSWSSLGGGTFAEGEPVDVELTTVDAAVAEYGLHPSVVKVDVEGHEVEVLHGMTQTLAEAQPVLLLEVSAHSAREVQQLLSAYRAFRIVGRRLVPDLASGGIFNVLFLPAGPAAGYTRPASGLS